MADTVDFNTVSTVGLESSPVAAALAGLRAHEAHLEHVPGAPNSGLDARAQFRIGAAKLLEMTFADFEARLRDELDRMLGPGEFSSDRDIAAITVNRWPHGYGYVANSLFDPDDYAKTVELARRPFGRIAIANSDSGGDAYAHLAIDAAARAVRANIRRSNATDF
jgi:spermidine dehydrogenase